MTTDAIRESGMVFGPFDKGELFYVEKSQCYAEIRQGVQMAEFLLLRRRHGKPSVIWIVEAKSSSPRSESTTHFQGFIEEIRCKLTHALLLGVAARLQRHPGAFGELPEPFQTVDLRSVEFRFVLVINGHKAEWLPPLQSALSLAMKPLVKTWALLPTSVAVLNHDLAHRHGLIGAFKARVTPRGAPATHAPR